jgi:hypothetical protein
LLAAGGRLSSRASESTGQAPNRSFCVLQVFEEIDRPARLQTAPDWGLALAGLFNPTIRAVKEQLYQVRRPWVVDSAEFERTFGWNATPLPEAGYLTGARGSSPPEPKGAFTRPFEVMVSGPDDVYVERKRRLERVRGQACEPTPSPLPGCLSGGYPVVNGPSTGNTANPRGDRRRSRHLAYLRPLEALAAGRALDVCNLTTLPSFGLRARNVVRGSRG